LTVGVLVVNVLEVDILVAFVLELDVLGRSMHISGLGQVRLS
jgi:hypothetical protein